MWISSIGGLTVVGVNTQCAPSPNPSPLYFLSLSLPCRLSLVFFTFNLLLLLLLLLFTVRVEKSKKRRLKNRWTWHRSRIKQKSNKILKIGDGESRYNDFCPDRRGATSRSRWQHYSQLLVSVELEKSRIKCIFHAPPRTTPCNMKIK